MLTKDFAGELFGPGQPLDASRYFIILPDAIGTGKSSKPSDGMRAKFPQYNYDDMVQAQYRLVNEDLGIRHLRLVLGNSMGGMQTWIWGAEISGFHGCPCAHGLVAHRDGQPQLDDAAHDHRFGPQRSGMEQRQLHAQPRNLQSTLVYFGIATSGGTQAYFAAHRRARRPTSSRPAPGAATVRRRQRPSLPVGFVQGLRSLTRARSGSEAALLAINSADDERNPPELGVMDREIKRVRNGRALLIPASEQTRGHGTTGMAKFWKQDLAALMQAAPLASK